MCDFKCAQVPAFITNDNLNSPHVFKLPSGDPTKTAPGSEEALSSAEYPSSINSDPPDANTSNPLQTGTTDGDGNALVRSSENVFVTEDFIKTIRGRNNANTHLKNPAWIFVCDAPHNNTETKTSEHTTVVGEGKKDEEGNPIDSKDGDSKKDGNPKNASDAAESKSAAANKGDTPRLKKVFVLISNFEAEKCSCLMASAINFPSIDDHVLDDGTQVIDAYGRPKGKEDGSGDEADKKDGDAAASTNAPPAPAAPKAASKAPTKIVDASNARQFNRLRFCPRLYAFASVVRLHQPEVFLRTGSYPNVPVSLHVFAGSIHSDKALFMKIKNYLALLPRPAERVSEEEAEEAMRSGSPSKGPGSPSKSDKSKPSRDPAALKKKSTRDLENDSTVDLAPKWALISTGILLEF